MLRFFERLDAIERAQQDQDELLRLLLAYVDADLEKSWEPAARALAEKLRKMIKK
jgi:hypothetical protein